jgi:hypothetical protein
MLIVAARFTHQVLPVRHVRARASLPISEDGPRDDHPRDEREWNGHTAAGERVWPAHVPRVAEETHPLLGVGPTPLDGWKERVEIVFRNAEWT